MLKHLKTSLLLASSLFFFLPQTQAQLGKNLKEKAQNLKPGKKEDKAEASKGGSKWDKRQFQGNPISDAVLNEDFKHNDEQKDATGISGYYYAYFPLTGKTEKVWVRYNNYKYDKEIRGVKFADSKQAAVTVYTKELNSFDAEKYVSYFLLEPWERLQWEQAGNLVPRTSPFITYPIVFKKDVFAVNVPVQIQVSGDRIPQYTFSWHLDSLAQYQKKTAQRYSNWEMMDKILANQPRSQFAIIAKDRKELEAYTDYEKLKKAVEEATKKSVQIENDYFIAVIEKPKAIKDGEFFTNKQWYETAKEGLIRNQTLAPGEKVLFGFVPKDLNWQTFTNRATGEPTHQQAFYYLVCQRNPERNNRRSEYFIIAAFIKRNHSGGGKYDQPVYNAHSDSVDITPSEMEAYKPFKIN